VNQTILITMYYTDDSPDRQREIDNCLICNLQNNEIDRIVVFTETMREYDPLVRKITQIEMKNRLTYQQAFEYANKYLSGDICILSNSDIVFDGSLSLLRGVDWVNKFYAITRHNLQHDGSIAFNDSNACQDTWIFKSPLKAFPSDFGLGRPGCDNRIVWEAQNSGLIVLNPCKIIICRHLHLTNKRNYVANQPVIPGPYGRAEFGDQL
jgi:hypothetical protein